MVDTLCAAIYDFTWRRVPLVISALVPMCCSFRSRRVVCMEQEMKLEGEIAKFGNAKVEVSETEVEAVTKFIAKLVPAFVKEAGGIFSDTVRYWKWKNQIHIVKKAKSHLESIGLQPKAPPLKIIVPLLESASLEEDTNIQEMWSKLLASALVDSATIVPNHIDTLKQLSPAEVRVLDLMYGQYNAGLADDKDTPVFFKPNDIAQAFHLTNDNAEIILEDLCRLGILVKPEVISKEVTSGSGHLFSTEFGPNKFQFRKFGLSFMKACKVGPTGTSRKKE